MAIGESIHGASVFTRHINAFINKDTTPGQLGEKKSLQVFKSKKKKTTNKYFYLNEVDNCFHCIRKVFFKCSLKPASGCRTTLYHQADRNSIILMGLN